MSTLLKYLLHLFAIISLYIILTVGFGLFWTIGSSYNYERINSVLINLSYSFITGYIVYVLTVLIPTKQRSNKINKMVARKLKSIVDHRLIPCLRIFVQPQDYNTAFSDEELIEMYENGNLVSNTFYAAINHNVTVIDALLNSRNSIVNEVDSLINKYGQDLSEDLLVWLEGVKKDSGLENCIAYKKLLEMRIAFNTQNGTTDAAENRKMANDFITLRDRCSDVITTLLTSKRFCSSKHKKKNSE